MKFKEIKAKNSESNYSIFIGNNILKILPKKIKKICPKALKIGLVIDDKVPKKKIILIKKLLKNYEVFSFKFSTSEKLKSIKNASALVDKCLLKNFNRTDVVMAIGGGVIGDFSGFVASLIKRGVNFINIPTTLLAQVDSSIGGKTGVNSTYGKNLIGSFYQPKLVISDVSFLTSLPSREMVCGYAEILKHAIILKSNFFNWLSNNSIKILKDKNINFLKEAVYRSCKVKLFFVNKDLKENNLRMVLNFGHTFAHAIEAKNNFSKKINHGEAVLMGMMMAAKLSEKKGITSFKTIVKLKKIYKDNKLNYNISDYFQKKDYSKIVNFMVNDKKNFDKKISVILLKSIGKTTVPGSIKFSLKDLKKNFTKII